MLWIKDLSCCVLFCFTDYTKKKKMRAHTERLQDLCYKKKNFLFYAGKFLGRCRQIWWRYLRQILSKNKMFFCYKRCYSTVCTLGNFLKSISIMKILKWIFSSFLGNCDQYAKYIKKRTMNDETLVFTVTLRNADIGLILQNNIRGWQSF